ncbi:isopenicillin N synthase family dioxygenase [Variovorax ginsengisoli]|uniref:2-oxoglutarate and iron-dependent oxygenase domain-containing protein n=1 Tax=Variovorax ginsengisoli TaxID=363844 RepID=A0ABT8SFU6_9BURK|nr:2-oxoglutarate and iron-dependent oxygenase domain-containing protein [Variovorax ginsengisoli]MDN8618592.1 2-oxoglutarate and iron-dependent oxygenase domain-containing protein [Variovorax ginsengisoli]MDO1537762.1 2-oxoglutarate and iron-dependent oxygenase domain-containing protein [Variovorax ginsengisoli]
MIERNLAPNLNIIRPDAPEEIPVFDLGPYLLGEAGAMEKLGTELRYALENVGFYFIVNHGLDQALIDRTFAAARRFHDLPLEEKLALKLNEHIRGYQPMKGAVTRHSAVNANNLPNVNEAIFFGPELVDDHPDVLAGKPFRGHNQWPSDLAGFREDVLAYTAAAQAVGVSLLPLYAHALELEVDFFLRGFKEPSFTFRMSHYPQTEVLQDNEFGLAPHSDTSFMTLLPENEVPGLSIRLPNGRWIDAPVLKGSILVNGGDMLRRYTNDRFLATPHKVVNRSGVERYAIPFFMDCSYDFVMECLPTCQSPSNPPRYEAFSYADYRAFYRASNFGPTLAATTA